MSEHLPGGGSTLSPAEIDALEARWSSCFSPGEVIRRSPAAIPYLAPELVLLFKARHARPKDQADFDATVPHLTAAQRRTLAGLLDHEHPGHPGRARL